jgi:serine/threonine protein kinase
MGFHLTADLTLDGYRLIRFLGRGGFGEVWLCRSEAMGGYHAMKLIAGDNASLLDKEYHALALYRKEAARLRSPHLVPIEHINRNESCLFYVMPLADGVSAGDPLESGWQPLSLAAMIETRRSARAWFSIEEISALMVPLLQALQTLTDAGLVHRDVKPDNILFFNGQPCLGDISLLGADASVITRRGTPGYATPSWYDGGHPDMYGAAATLFTLLTGNLPDKMGRSAFLWPPQGEKSLAESERAEWKRHHSIIRRATDEKVAERYVDFSAMAGALKPVAVAAVTTSRSDGPKPNRPKPKSPLPNRPKSKSPLRAVVGVLMLSVLLVAVVMIWSEAGRGISSDGERSAEEVAAEPMAAGPVAAEPGATDQTGQSDNTAVRSVPKVDRSPRDPNKASDGLADAMLALNSLAWIADEGGAMSQQEAKILGQALVGIKSSILENTNPGFETAARLLDECLEAVPALKKKRNSRLARLLLLQCAGDQARVDAAINDPSHLILGSDNLSYRVELLTRLGNPAAARQLLDNYVLSGAATPLEKSQGLIERARLRTGFGNYDEARADVERALLLAGDSPAERTHCQMELAEIERAYPGFAAYLKTQQGK